MAGASLAQSAMYLTHEHHGDIPSLRRGRRGLDKIVDLLGTVAPDHPHITMAKTAAGRLGGCTQNVVVAQWTDQETGECRSKVLMHQKCEHRGCRICGRKRAAKDGNKLVAGLMRAIHENPDKVSGDVLHLVFSQLNTDYERSPERAALHRAAFGNLMRRTFFADRIPGAYRVQEFEPGRDVRLNDHQHVAALPVKGYFDRDSDWYIPKFPRACRARGWMHGRREQVRRLAAKALGIPATALTVLPIGRFDGARWIKYDRVLMQRWKRKESRRLIRLGYTVLAKDIPTYDSRHSFVGGWRREIESDYWPTVWVSKFNATKDGTPDDLKSALQVVKYVSSGIAGETKHDRNGDEKPAFSGDQLTYVLASVAGKRIAEPYGLLRSYLTESAKPEDDAEIVEDAAEATVYDRVIHGEYDRAAGGFRVVREWGCVTEGEVKFDAGHLWPNELERRRSDRETVDDQEGDGLREERMAQRKAEEAAFAASLTAAERRLVEHCGWSLPNIANLRQGSGNTYRQ